MASIQSIKLDPIIAQQINSVLASNSSSTQAGKKITNLMKDIVNNSSTSEVINPDEKYLNLTKGICASIIKEIPFFQKNSIEVLRVAFINYLMI